MAAEAGRPNSLALLLAQGLDPNTQDAAGWTPSMRAARGGVGHWAANSDGRLECLRRLIQAGADPNFANLNRKTALSMAAADGVEEAVEALIAAGALLDHMERDQTTPAMAAAAGGHAACLLRLLEAGADPRLVDERGRTLAIHAAGDAACLDLATRFGCDPLVADGLEMDAFDHAARSKNAAGLRALLASWAPNPGSRPITLLAHACMGADPECVQAVLDAGADPDQPGDDGDTALMTAARSWDAGSLACARMLLARGAKIDAVDHHGRTALMHAAFDGEEDAALLLAEAGAALDLADGAGSTAADIAQAQGADSLASTLRAMQRSRTERMELLAQSAPPAPGRSPRI